MQGDNKSLWSHYSLQKIECAYVCVALCVLMWLIQYMRYVGEEKKTGLHSRKDHMVQKNSHAHHMSTWRDEQIRKHLHLASIRPACFIVITINSPTHFWPWDINPAHALWPLCSTWPTDLHMEIYASWMLRAVKYYGSKKKKKSSVPCSTIWKRGVIIPIQCNGGRKPALWTNARSDKEIIKNR